MTHGLVIEMSFFIQKPVLFEQHRYSQFVLLQIVLFHFHHFLPKCLEQFLLHGPLLSEK